MDLVDFFKIFDDWIGLAWHCARALEILWAEPIKLKWEYSLIRLYNLRSSVQQGAY